MSTYQHKREPLTPEETARLSGACQKGEERLVIWTLLDTGLRLGEFLDITPDSFDWAESRLLVHSGDRRNEVRLKERAVPLTRRAQSLLEAYFAIHDSVEMSRRKVQYLVKRIAVRAGIERPVTPQVLRHTYSVTALEKGISLPSLQRLLGHDHLGSTQLYVRPSPEDALSEFHAKW